VCNSNRARVCVYRLAPSGDHHHCCHRGACACAQILFYKYVAIGEAVELVVEEQHALCTRLGLLGRLLIAEEGINGTLSGPGAV
jgi:hypothetical protein